MSALSIRGFVVFQGHASQGWTPIVPQQFLFNAGDPVMFVLDLTALADATSQFRNQIAKQSGSSVQSQTWIWQEATTDLSGHTFMAVIGIGPIA